MKQGQQPALLVEGHYDGEVWGLATSPREYQYITCGGDKIIRLWDMESKKMLGCSKPFENDIRAVNIIFILFFFNNNNAFSFFSLIGKKMDPLLLWVM